MTYRDKQWQFEIDLPAGWRRAGFFHRLKHKGAPEFFSPQNASIKFAIGPITPVPDYREHMENLKRIAGQHGHRVLAAEGIEVGGKQHATMTVTIPLPSGQSLRCKHYALIFDGIEYFVSASLAAGDSEIDAIIKTFRKP